MIWIAGIVLLLVGTLAAVLVLLLRAYRRLAALEVDIAELARGLEAADGEFAAVLTEVSGSRIIVELINPMTLARERSRWGAALSGLAPRLIRRRVYDTVAREMKQRLAENGVESRLEIFHPTGS